MNKRRFKTRNGIILVEARNPVTVTNLGGFVDDYIIESIPKGVNDYEHVEGDHVCLCVIRDIYGYPTATIGYPDGWDIVEELEPKED